MSLHVETIGRGAPLVLLHGWGMHGGVWSELAAQLAQDFEVHCVDLPGHGLSGNDEKGGVKWETAEPPIHFPLNSSPFTLESVVDELSVEFAKPLNLCGWSLGGIIAQHWAAREPEKIEKLVLVASTPRFSACEDWGCGMPQETLEQFAVELEKNFAVTLRRFLALQVRGSEGERELLAGLRENLFSRGEPDMKALRGGLDILRHADLRSALSQIKQPSLVIAGERDRLTPPQASYYLAQTMPNACVVEIEGAAHAPFLSHSSVFIEHLKSFLHE